MPAALRVASKVIGWAFLAGVCYSLVQLFLDRQRKFNREILPKVAKSLIPLNPTRDELTDCLGRLQQTGFSIGKKAKLEALWKLINQADLALPRSTI